MDKKPRSLLAIVGVVAILAAGAVAAQKAGLLGGSSPEKALAGMQERLADVTRLAYEATLNVETPLPPGLFDQTGQSGKTEEVSGTVLVTATGAVDANDPENPKSTLVLDAAAQSDGKQNSLGIEMRGLGKDSYLRLTRAPKIGLFDLRVLEGQWVSLKAGELKNQFGSLKKSSGGMVETETSDTKLTPEQKKQLLKALFETGAISVEKKLNSESVNGVSTHHLALAVDKEALVRYQERSAEITGKPWTQADADKLRKVLADVTVESFEIWIGKTDSLPRKISLRFTSKRSGDGVMTGTLTVLLDKYGQPVEVSAPTSAKSLSELLSGLSTPPLEKTPLR